MRPARLKGEWVMPVAPVCKQCGTSIEAVAYIDVSEVYFFWDEWCSNCNETFDSDSRSDDWGDWPFDVDLVSTEDIEAAGFRVE